MERKRRSSDIYRLEENEIEYKTCVADPMSILQASLFRILRSTSLWRDPRIAY